MESWEYKTLVNELVQGMEKAKQLHFHLCSTSTSTSTSPSRAQDLLMQRILSSYEKALLILNWKGAGAVQQTPAASATSISVDDLNNNLRDHHDYNASKKRWDSLQY